MLALHHVAEALLEFVTSASLATLGSLLTKWLLLLRCRHGLSTGSGLLRVVEVALALAIVPGLTIGTKLAWSFTARLLAIWLLRLHVGLNHRLTWQAGLLRHLESLSRGLLLLKGLLSLGWSRVVGAWRMEEMAVSTEAAIRHACKLAGLGRRTSFSATAPSSSTTPTSTSTATSTASITSLETTTAALEVLRLLLCRWLYRGLAWSR